MKEINNDKRIKNVINEYMKRVAILMVISIIFVAMLFLALYKQTHNRDKSRLAFTQIKQILSENQLELLEVQEAYRKTCLYSADAIAYIIQHYPEVMDSIESLEGVAEFIEVDEIHIFDKTGKIVNGTHPEYYNMTFDSGEQIGFFKPMLNDKTLRLCQDITPNTAESRPMQYSAVWSRDEEFILQVGMEPVNVLKVTKKNELSYIFSLLSVDKGVNFYAIDANTGEIMGATNENDLGKNLKEIGFSLNKINDKKEGFHDTINGRFSYCVFEKVGENYIGRVILADAMYEDVPTSLLAIAIIIIFVAIMLVYAVTSHLNKYVIKDIYKINESLSAIVNGSLNEEIDANGTTEFIELSNHINEMKKSILATTDKISYVLNKTDMHIGVYEYNLNMDYVRFTDYIPQILNIDNEIIEDSKMDCSLLKKHIKKLCENPVKGEHDVYRIIEDREIYVRLEENIQNNEVFGVIIDVTDEVLRRRLIESERDIDLLTGLYNRRGIENKLSELFAEFENLGHSAIIMLDADGLKGINDKYGHDKGDIYLEKMAEVINIFERNSCLTGRLGGDEFIIFLYRYSSEKELLDSINTLRYLQENSTAHLSDNLIVPIKFSFGVSLTKKERDYQKLIKDADEKMYENKRSRKCSKNN